MSDTKSDISYTEVVRRFESTGQRLANALGGYMHAADADYTVSFTKPWRDDVRELARGMLMYPELIISYPAPPEYATLYALYQQWAGRFKELAYRVLDLVSALDRVDVIAAGDELQRVVATLKVVSALTEARSIYVDGLTQKQQT
jgi:hypothetical protein